jgi:hypothetical protein
MLMNPMNDDEEEDDEVLGDRSTLGLVARKDRHSFINDVKLSFILTLGCRAI